MRDQCANRCSRTAVHGSPDCRVNLPLVASRRAGGGRVVEHSLSLPTSAAVLVELSSAFWSASTTGLSRFAAAVVDDDESLSAATVTSSAKVARNAADIFSRAVTTLNISSSVTFVVAAVRARHTTNNSCRNGHFFLKKRSARRLTSASLSRRPRCSSGPISFTANVRCDAATSCCARDEPPARAVDAARVAGLLRDVDDDDEADVCEDGFLDEVGNDMVWFRFGSWEAGGPHWLAGGRQQGRRPTDPRRRRAPLARCSLLADAEKSAQRGSRSAEWQRRLTLMAPSSEIDRLSVVATNQWQCHRDFEQTTWSKTNPKTASVTVFLSLLCI